MIIFGWGKQIIKQIGITFKRACNHCHNKEYWTLTRTTTWFTLFFIPIIPYSIKYFLSCPVCQYGLTLDGKQTRQIKPLAEANQLLIDGRITEAEYQARMNELNDESPIRVEAKTTEQKELVSGSKNIGFCSGCGTKVIKEIKFCGNCGIKVSEK